MTSTTARPLTTSRTFHRWTREEDERLLKAVQDDMSVFESIGQPGGIARDIFWGQIPGRINVLSTPAGCHMRYRTLTGTTEWAHKRRPRPVPVPDLEPDPMVKMQLELSELKEQVRKLVKMWE